MADFDRWIYHATEAPIIIKCSEFEEYEDKGWKDSPAHFIKTTDFGIEPDNALGVQALGETIEGVKDAANGALNIGSMSKNELEAYALKHFDIDLDKRKKAATLRQEVNDLIGAEYIEV